MLAFNSCRYVRNALVNEFNAVFNAIYSFC
jgi:hypothetical protein